MTNFTIFFKTFKFQIFKEKEIGKSFKKAFSWKIQTNTAKISYTAILIELKSSHKKFITRSHHPLHHQTDENKSKSEKPEKDEK